LNSRDASRSNARRHKDLPSLLVFAHPSPEIDDLLASLDLRSDLCLLRVTTMQAAGLALRDVAVDLMIICHETSDDTVAALLDQVEARRPGIPVLALRSKGAVADPRWRTGTVALLPTPVRPEVMSRTVDVALRLRP
jgi:hypothetical protein